MIIDKQEFIPLIVTSNGVMKLQPQFEENYYEMLPNDWFELMQFTGLKDKNGVEIYEGDIIELEDRICKINFNEYCGCWDLEFIRYTKDNSCVFKGVNYKNWCKYEVIGNIYDNPELLESK